jgi:hypothetical protein
MLEISSVGEKPLAFMKELVNSSVVILQSDQ